MENIIDFAFVGEVFFRLLAYVPITLGLAISSMVLASIWGLLIMVLRLRKIPLLGRLAKLYILVGRALPTMVILYLVFFALPVVLLIFSDATGREVTINQVPAMVFAVLGLSIHTGAYLAENFRSAVQSVEKGQLEAAVACGMTWQQGFRRIILPQAAVFALPLLGNQFLTLLKGTSIAFMITVMELFGAANVLCSENNRYLEVYLVVALLYWAISAFFEKAFFVLEHKLAFFKRGMKP